MKTSSAEARSAGVSAARRTRVAELGGQLDEVRAGDAGQDAGLLGRRGDRAAADDEDVGRGALDHAPRRVEDERLLGAARLGLLEGEQAAEVVADLGALRGVGGALGAHGHHRDAVPVERGRERRQRLDQDDAQRRAGERRIEAERARTRG